MAPFETDTINQANSSYASYLSSDITYLFQPEQQADGHAGKSNDFATRGWTAVSEFESLR